MVQFRGNMYRGNGSRIFPIIIVLIIVAIAIAALVSVGRSIFGGGDTSQEAVDPAQAALLNTSASHSVRMTVRGPIVAEEQFRSYQVTVSPDSRTLTTYSGYLAQPIDTKQLSNNVKSYDEFVHALDLANMVEGEAFTGEKDDTRGICANGKLFEFEVLQAGSTVKRLWTSTCRGSAGSLRANATQLQDLFLDQIPDNREILKKIDLSN